MGKAYHVFVDSFFSSVSLFHRFLSDDIYCTGSLLSNRRNFPPDLKDTAKCGLGKRGDMVARQDENVSVCVWQDTWPVTFMSSGHNPYHIKPVSRKRVDGSIMHVDCPQCIVDYNMYMEG